MMKPSNKDDMNNYKNETKKRRLEDWKTPKKEVVKTLKKIGKK